MKKLQNSIKFRIFDTQRNAHNYICKTGRLRLLTI